MWRNTIFLSICSYLITVTAASVLFSHDNQDLIANSDFERYSPSSNENQNEIELPKITGRMKAKARPGDPGVKFNSKSIKQNKKLFPQMKRWSQAGVTGGIPLINSLKVNAMLDGGDSAAINKKIDELAKDKKQRVLLLKNGKYKIDAQIVMKSNVIIIGESRNKVKCQISMETGNSFLFGSGVKRSGIYRLTIEGTWGKPKLKWNIGSDANNELPENENVSVMFKGATDCWLDGVNIYNSGDFPLRCNAKHITLRGLDVNGVFNKHGGAHGYFFILNSDNLITQSKITHLRHISLQGDGVEYNVVYDNNFRQEISFHANDDGNNLIAQNRITLPADMPNGKNGRPNYRAIMGPWASFHTKSKRDNFLHKNKILELNHKKARRMTDNAVYAGPVFDFARGDELLKNFEPLGKVPKGNTLYPIILK